MFMRGRIKKKAARVPHSVLNYIDDNFSSVVARHKQIVNDFEQVKFSVWMCVFKYYHYESIRTPRLRSKIILIW